MANMPKIKEPLENPDADPGQDETEFQFVKVARPDIGQVWDVIRRIGNTIIGGDFSGNARGQGSIDIQQARTNPADVASGEKSIIFGSYARASGARSLALGTYAATDLPDTCNLSGLIVLKANYGNALDYICECGTAEIVLATPVVDFTQIAEHDIILPTAPGHACLFFPSECMAIATHMAGRQLTAPVMQFGNPDDLDCLVPPTACDNIFRGNRYERFTINWDNGQTALSGSIFDGALMEEGGILKGRLLFKGILVEEEGDAF
jgi:hypothetical protein